MGSASNSLEALVLEVSALRTKNADLEQKLEISESARRECDERFRDLAENIQEVFWIDTPDLTKTFYVSLTYEEIWGRSCQSLYEKPRSFIDAIHPHDHDRIHTRIESQSWEGFCEEYRIVRPDGEIRWIRDRACPVRDESGKTLRVIRIAEDISADKAGEASLRKYEQLVSTTPDLMAFVDTDYRYQTVNKQYAEFVQRPQELIIGRLIVDILGPAMFERIKMHFDQCFSGKSVNYQHWVDTPKGAKRYLDVHYLPAVDSDGSIFGVVADIRDLTELKLAEQNILENQIFLNSIIENIPYMIFVKDAKNLQFLRFNKAGEKLLDYPKETLIGKTDYDIFPKSEADFFSTKDREVLSGKTLFDIPEEVIHTKTQGTRYLHTKKIPIVDDHGTPKYLLGISEDITEQKQTELERTEREILLQLIFETGPGCIKRVAADGTVLDINPGGLTIIEADGINEAVGCSIFGLIAPEHVEAYRRMHQHVLQGTPQTLQYEILGMKGARRWVETYAVPFSNPLTKEVEQLAITHDITERKASEEKAKQLSRQNELILSSAGDGIYGLNLDGQAKFVNPAGAHMLGYEPKELIGLSMHAAIHHTKPDGSPYPQEECPMYAAFTDGTIHKVEDEVLWRKDGTSVPVEYSSTPIWQDGNLVGAVVTFRDISERKHAEEVLKKSKQDFQTLVDSLEGVVWEADFPSYRFTFVSQEAERMLGYPIEQWLTQPNFFCNRLHASDQSWVVEYCREATLRKENHEMEYRFLHANGEEIWLKDLVTVVVEHDQPVKLRGVMFNITQIKKAENVLKESEERFRLLNEAIPQQVWTANPDGSLDYVNQRVLQYFGCSFEEILGQGWQQFLHPDDLSGCLECWDKARQTQQPYEIEFRLLRGKDHSFRWYLGRGLPIFDEDGEVVKWFGTNTDITQFKQLENQIRQSQKMEAIGTLAGGIAHDFNNILMAITGYSELAILNASGNSAAQRNLEEVLVAGQRAKELVQQILAFSRQTEHERQPIELKMVVKEVCKFLRASLPTTVEIRQNFTKAPTIILGDPIQMHQVVMNLCANAEHVMRESGGILELKVEHVTGETDDMDIHPGLKGGSFVRLTVRDTGAGIMVWTPPFRTASGVPSWRINSPAFN